MRSLHHHLPANGSTVKQQLHDSLKTLVARLNAQTGQTVEVIDGGPIFDLKPQGPDKATAMADIMKFALGRYSGTLPLVPLYFGDSPGDLPAAHFVRENGGKFIAVGDDPRVTAIADFRLANPAECRALVATIAGMMPRRANTIVPPGLTP
jgi:hydroxymethylpyrimidine pyrophosphatase-like HAD family hydrolase